MSADSSLIEGLSKVEDLSEIEDFSKRITPVKGAKTGVFWDVEDCPFPVGWSPDMIYEKIESTLSDMGSNGKMSIWAYVDEKKGSWGEFLRKKTWKARIYFLTGGDKPARLDRMLHDILFWVMDSPVDRPNPTDLIVVSDKVRYDDKEFFDILRVLYLRSYSVFLVTPTEDARPESSEWPGLLFDQIDTFGFESDSEEHSRKKHKAEEGSEDQA